MWKQEYNAKLSDFGLAKDGPMGDKTHVSTRIMGTYGYAAPEYIMTGKFCTKFSTFLCLQALRHGVALMLLKFFLISIRNKLMLSCLAFEMKLITFMFIRRIILP